MINYRYISENTFTSSQIQSEAVRKGEQEGNPERQFLVSAMKIAQEKLLKPYNGIEPASLDLIRSYCTISICCHSYFTFLCTARDL